MVMYLTAPKTCSLQIIEDIVAERKHGKNAKFFENIATDWRDKVQQYIDACGSPAVIKPWPQIDSKKTSFLNLYCSPKDGSVQGEMLKELRAHELNLCPSCGEAGRPNTLDHYLPKEAYPHFCVTPYNLFPMCDICQGKKGVKTGGTVNPRFFLHPYFDVFVAKQVIELTIDPPYVTPTFNLQPDTTLTLQQSRLVESHIRELEIVQRYGRFFREQYIRLLRLVQEIRESKQEVDVTLELFRKDADRLSKNAWDYVFYSAVLSNPALMTYLRKEDLPAYL